MKTVTFQHTVAFEINDGDDVGDHLIKTANGLTRAVKIWSLVMGMKPVGPGKLKWSVGTPRNPRKKA